MNGERAVPIQILLVEDNPGDARLAREAIRSYKLANELHHVEDGVAAMDFLRLGEPRPDLILLDLNLPKKDGRQVLKEIKQDQSLRRIPVCVLTTSSAESDLAKSYDNYANCYITKPVDFDQFVKVVRSIEDFWLSIVRLPPN
jgi:chemotaxis family two-component system response regulator Rcp1